MWLSRMQPLATLSTTEAEYIALYAEFREVIAVKSLLSKIQSRNFFIANITPRVTCKVFEENKMYIDIATNHKTRARTNHLSVRLHHFRSHVVNKTIQIEHISTKEQVEDIFTKLFPSDQFEKLRNQLMSWVLDLILQGSERI